jgi:MurNAc alpha-1-phosphate uridylyltransferase
MSNNVDKAFILAAGMGRRLRPYTDTLPKPMVKVGGLPLIDHAINKLRQAGVSEVAVNLHYMADILEEHLQGSSNSELHLFHEEKLMGTGGGFKAALPMMEGNAFYAVSGDSIWTDGDIPALERMSAAWDPDKMDILLLLQPVSNMVLTTGLGDYDLDADGKAVRSFDKSGEYMWTSIRIISASIFEGSPDDAPFSFLELLDAAEEKDRLYGLVHDADWHHISTAEDLDRVNAAYEGEKKYA